MKTLRTILFSLLVLVMGFGMTSCTATQSFGIVYDLNVTGDGDGQFDVTFPNGKFGMDGKAGLGFELSNDTTKMLMANNALTAEQIQASNDPKQLTALANVNTWVDQNFQATSATGSYDLLIQGYAKETLTGIVIAVDKRITNRK